MAGFLARQHRGLGKIYKIEAKHLRDGAGKSEPSHCPSHCSKAKKKTTIRCCRGEGAAGRHWCRTRERHHTPMN